MYCYCFSIIIKRRQIDTYPCSSFAVHCFFPPSFSRSAATLPTRPDLPRFRSCFHFHTTEGRMCAGKGGGRKGRGSSSTLLHDYNPPGILPYAEHSDCTCKNKRFFLFLVPIFLVLLSGKRHSSLQSIAFHCQFVFAYHITQPGSVAALSGNLTNRWHSKRV